MLTSGFFNSVSEDRKYDAIDMSRLFDGIIVDGVFAAVGEKLQIFTGGGMVVDFGTGRAWFDHTWSYNDARFSHQVEAADALLNRIDVCYLETNHDVGTRQNSFSIKKGLAATNPLPPSLTNTDTIKQYALAHIYVGAGVTEIEKQNITNKVGSYETPWVTGPLSVITSAELVAQWEDEFNTWFDNIVGSLLPEPATSLQLQVWAIVGFDGAPNISLLDLETHDHSAIGSQIPTNGIKNSSVTHDKMALNAVGFENIIDGAIITSKLATNTVTESKILNGSVTVGKLATNSVSTEKIVNNSVDDTKVGNRVPQLYRRLGAGTIHWNQAGEVVSDPGMVRMQVGSTMYSSGTGNPQLVTYPVAFSANPILIFSTYGSGWNFDITTQGPTGFTIQSADAPAFAHIYWLAVGPE